jgi:hypothetical protein
VYQHLCCYLPFNFPACFNISSICLGDIGLFKITSEGGVAAGVRRIEAVTGTKALEVVQKAEADIQTINALLKAQKDQTVEKVESIVETASSLQKQIEQLNQKLASFQAADLLDQVKEIAGRQTLITSVKGLDAKSLRNLHDSVKSKLEDAVIILAGVDGDKVSLIASVAKQYAATLKAGELFIDVEAICQTAGIAANNYTLKSINDLITPLSYISAVENITVSTGGADDEDVESLRERIRQAPESFSNAGSKGAYRFHTLSAHQSITDVAVLSPSPGVVEVYPLTKTGNPSAEILAIVQKYLRIAHLQLHQLFLN